GRLAFFLTKDSMVLSSDAVCITDLGVIISRASTSLNLNKFLITIDSDSRKTPSLRAISAIALKSSRLKTDPCVFLPITLVVKRKTQRIPVHFKGKIRIFRVFAVKFARFFQ